MRKNKKIILMLVIMVLIYTLLCSLSGCQKKAPSFLMIPKVAIIEICNNEYLIKLKLLANEEIDSMQVIATDANKTFTFANKLINKLVLDDKTQNVSYDLQIIFEEAVTVKNVTLLINESVVDFNIGEYTLIKSDMPTYLCNMSPLTISAFSESITSNNRCFDIYINNNLEKGVVISSIEIVSVPNNIKASLLRKIDAPVCALAKDSNCFGYLYTTLLDDTITTNNLTIGIDYYYNGKKYYFEQGISIDKISNNLYNEYQIVNANYETFPVNSPYGIIEYEK